MTAFELVSKVEGGDIVWEDGLHIIENQEEKNQGQKKEVRTNREVCTKEKKEIFYFHRSYCLFYFVTARHLTIHL